MRLALRHFAAIFLLPTAFADDAVDAELRLRLNLNNLHHAGVALEFLDPVWAEDGQTLVFRPARLGFRRPVNGRFPAGGMDLPAAFRLTDRVFHAQSFLVDADARTARWTFAAADGTRHEFVFTRPHTLFKPDTGHFEGPDMDVLNLSFLPAGAHAPGFLIAAADLEVQFPGAGLVLTAAHDCLPDFGPSDLELTQIADTLQLHRVAGDRVAFAPAAHLRNIGDHDVRWEWAIAPAEVNRPLIGPHPFLIMNAYRVRDGRLEPLGRSDVKHAWNSMNENCGCLGGQVMYQGCSDIYSASNNGAQFYFGPRAEVNPRTGAWDSLGSHFDGIPVDNVRSHFTSGHGPLDHRLTVAESALGDATSQYWVEAWYLSAQETNQVNNLGHRGLQPTLVAGVWQFPPSTLTRAGPAIQSWVPFAADTPDQRHTAAENADGRAQLAVQVRRLPSGQFRYDYALFNLDHASGLVGLALPIPDTVTTTHHWFADGDGLADNDWLVHSDGAESVWAGAGLVWGGLHAISFESAFPPQTGQARLLSAGPEPLPALETLVPTPMRVIEGALGPEGLAWEALPGAVYRVERATRLSAPADWTDISGPLSTTGSRLTFRPQDGPAGEPVFFRVILSSP
jgi:hypothetical protein